MKTLAFCLLLVVAPGWAQRQRTLYFDASGQRAPNAAAAAFYATVRAAADDANHFEVKTFYLPSKQRRTAGSYQARVAADAIEWQALEEPGFWDAVREGPHTCWYENGVRQEQVDYEGGRKTGDYRLWYAGGQKKAQARVYKGGEVGLVKVWYESGQLQMQYPCVEGVIDGEVKEWWENGQLKSRLVVSGNQADATTQQRWSEDGTPVPRE